MTHWLDGPHAEILAAYYGHCADTWGDEAFTLARTSAQFPGYTFNDLLEMIYEAEDL